jgi:hypothetical protein
MDSIIFTENHPLSEHGFLYCVYIEGKRYPYDESGETWFNIHNTPERMGIEISQQIKKRNSLGENINK